MLHQQIQKCPSSSKDHLRGVAEEKSAVNSYHTSRRNLQDITNIQHNHNCSRKISENLCSAISSTSMIDPYNYNKDVSPDNNCYNLDSNNNLIEDSSNNYFSKNDKKHEYMSKSNNKPPKPCTSQRSYWWNENDQHINTTINNKENNNNINQSGIIQQHQPINIGKAYLVLNKPNCCYQNCNCSSNTNPGGGVSNTTNVNIFGDKNL